MGHKNQFQTIFNWQATNPATGFLPLNNNTYSRGSQPSGVASGVMTGTNVIYSQILDITLTDNQGIEITWTGTPTGVIEIQVSNSGINFYSLTFNPALAQPAGSGSGYVISLNQLPFKYMLIKYTNASGSGVLTAYGQQKDLN